MSIQVRGLSFGYGARTVLENIDFEVFDGEVVSLVGSNGAGKSTLLKCVNRINKPASRAILAEGRNVAEMGLKQMAKIFGYVPQSAPTSFFSTVFETVLLGRRHHLGWGVDKKNKEKVFETLFAMDLDRMTMRQFNRVSGGEQQKVLMARALAQGPKVLLLDETTSKLDLRRQLEVLELVMGIVREKKHVRPHVHPRFEPRLPLLRPAPVFEKRPNPRRRPPGRHVKPPQHQKRIRHRLPDQQRFGKTAYHSAGDVQLMCC